MPMGYQTLVGDMGSSLSGGQKQLLALAAIMVTEPNVLVADEPTTALDVTVQRQIIELQILRGQMAMREKRGRNHRRTRHAAFFEIHRVVDTPRRAAASVTPGVHHRLHFAFEFIRDQITGGKILAHTVHLHAAVVGITLDIGVGRGVSPFELGYHNVDHSKSRDMFIDAYDCVREGMKADFLTYEGEFYTYKEAPIELHPFQSPPPFWYGSSNTVGATWAGEHGMHFTANGPTAFAGKNIDAYKEALAKWNAAINPDRSGKAALRPRCELAC